MARTRSLAALLVLGTAVTACGPGARQANTSLYSVNQPVVQRTDYVLDLATGADGVSPFEQGRLHGWFESLQLRYGDRIALDERGGAGDGTVREDIAEAAGRYGLLVDDGAPVTEGEVQPGTVRVVVSRTTASVPNCPNWGGQEPGGRSSTSPNYGCAVNSNLAAMIADPNDLVLGQEGSGTGDPASTTRAIRSYRDAVPTGTRGLQQNNTSNTGNR
ncbi:MAG TPA: CpaD family pilus assembly lipoprotein [Allosphingosinicella sp.]